jgi:hypothetical protein
MHGVTCMWEMIVLRSEGLMIALIVSREDEDEDGSRSLAIKPIVGCSPIYVGCGIGPHLILFLILLLLLSTFLPRFVCIGYMTYSPILKAQQVFSTREHRCLVPKIPKTESVRLDSSANYRDCTSDIGGIQSVLADTILGHLGTVSTFILVAALACVRVCPLPSGGVHMHDMIVTPCGALSESAPMVHIFTSLA